MKVKVLVAVIAVILFIGFLIFDALIKEKAMKENEKVVKVLRSHRNGFTDIIMIFFSALVYSEVFILILFVAYVVSRDKLNSLANICYLALGVYINSVSKLFYGEGRPFFFYDSINVIGKCERGLGHPSGHAMMGMVLIILCIDWVIHEADVASTRRGDIENENEDLINDNCKFSHLVIYMMGSLVIFVIGLSRVYLGVHSFEQILSGWAYGVLYLIFHYFFGKKLIKDSLVTLGNHRELWKFKKFFALCCIILLGIVALVFPIIVFEARSNPANRNRMNQLIIKNCGKTKPIVLDKKILCDCGIIGSFIGILLGAYFSKGKYNAQDVYNKEILSCAQGLKRFFVLFAFFALMIAIYLSMHATKEVFSNYIIGGFLNFMLFGFNIVFLSPILFKKLGVVFSGDFLKIEENNRVMPR